MLDLDVYIVYWWIHWNEFIIDESMNLNRIEFNNWIDVISFYVEKEIELKY